MSPLGLGCEHVLHGTFVDWFSSHQQLDSKQLCVMTMVSWSIWFNRNGVVHGNPSTYPELGVSNSLRIFHEFRFAKAMLTLLTPTNQAQRIKNGSPLLWGV